MEKSKEILRKYWGFNTFRPLQEEIIDQVIYGHDTLALLPTGGGKSLCFQIPGIAREGLTLVISPLIALMQDQVKNLQKKGIRAKEITSGMSYKEIDLTLDNARFGGIDFLYTSPERLQSKLFLERFKGMNVGLLVVDEAHCISEWGHDFRPAYKQIHKLREIHPEVPIIALTATATKDVQKDIIEQLKLKNTRQFEGSFIRPNLHYKVIESTSKNNEILRYCTVNNGKSGIIYCQTRKSVKELARSLHESGLRVGIYHGGMNREDRNLMMQSWMNNSINIMVSTNAFGMGIDKPDVRFVLHYEFPSNLEAYFQEAGRAGRDEKDAEAIVFWEQNDIQKLSYIAEIQFPPLETIKTTYRALCNHLKIAIGSGKEETYAFELRNLTEKFNLNNSSTYHALKILEINGDIVFTESVFNPTRLRIAIGNTELYSFQIKHEKLAPIITLLSRSYPGIFDNYFEIEEEEFAKRLKVSLKDINQQLKQLEQYGILDITWQSSLPTVTLTHERLPDDYLQITAEAYKNRKDRTNERLKAALHYLTSEECRLAQLLRYFGQEEVLCGTCDNCTSPPMKIKEIREKVLKLLSEKPHQVLELKESITQDINLLNKVLQHLLLDEKIIEVNSYFSLPNRE